MFSLLPLNGKNTELGGFSIGYVNITPELTDNQVSLYSPVGTTYPFAVMSSSPPLNGRVLSLATLNQLCSYYL